MSAETTIHSHAKFLQWITRHHLLLTACFVLTSLMALGINVSRPDAVPDFAAYTQTEEKKQAFFNYIAGYAEAVNSRIMKDRAFLLGLRESLQEQELSWFNHVRLARIKALYLPEDAEFEHDAALLDELLLRVDRVPQSLILVQAAKESGWGSSRFARQGYNFFGHQCFDPGCGFMPKRRASGRRHEVAKFASTEDSVRAFVHNLNTHINYSHFRQLRHEARLTGRQLNGSKLADGLMSYSERGQVYIDEIKGMIRRNDLD